MKSAVRRVLLLSALLSPSALYALGLGEIRLNSALNQPFDAEIELISAADDDLSALRASLASSDTFVRYGLEKPAYLSDFSFRVARSGGRDVLRITSDRPVTEPFVTMLVEASWPRGRLLREYTVLLDPPVFAPAPASGEAPVATPRVSAPPPAPAARRAPPPPAPVATTPRASRPVATATIEPGSTYHVRPNDTLWQIANAANPGSRSDVNRAMVAIYQANPSAFGGNINVLRAGSDLSIPSTSDMSAISASAAAAEVARQYQLWREGRSEGATTAEAGGRLRLVTPEQGTAAPSTSTSVPAAAPGAAASAGLQDRVKELEAELAEARRLLEVRNAELATLQGSAPAPEAAPAEPAPSEAVAPAEETAEAPAAEPEATPPAVAEAPAPAEPEAAPPAAMPEESPSLFDRLRDYWWVLLGLLAAALGIGAFLRSRREDGSAEEDLREELTRRPADDLRDRPTIVSRPRETDILVEEREPVAPPPAPVVAPEPTRKPVSIEDTLSGEAPLNLEAGDPLAEADFHMAYGLYDQAADLVQVAAKREPGRRDLKLKLLEIFFVWGNRDRFLEIARDMHRTSSDAQPGEWDKVLIMGKQIAPEDSLFAGAAPSTSDSLDMELQGGDADVDVDLGVTEATGTDFDPTLAQAEQGESGLDFVLDEPVRGEDEESTGPGSTVETPRTRPGVSEEPTAEVPIEDLGLDVGDVEGLDDIDIEKAFAAKAAEGVDDTIEHALDEAAELESETDLLSATSILKGDEIAASLTEEATADYQEEEVIDSAAVTGELPTIEVPKSDSTGIMPPVDFSIDGEAATMSEVGTKLDLARAYIDMGDPEGARSILDEVLKEGNSTQRKEAERLIASLP